MINKIFEENLDTHSPGYIIEIVNGKKQDEIVIGNRQTIPNIKKTNRDTKYDIASLTKLFTSTLIYIAYENKLIDIYNTIYEIDNNFINLKEVRVIDLLSHNIELWTDGYLGDSKTKEEFYKIIYSSRVKSLNPTYVDVHYIILGLLLEKIYNRSLDKLIEKYIINKLNLKNTTFNPSGDNIASCNYEHKNNEEISNITLGLIHDSKARIAKEFGITTGHASIFTTGKDLIKFLRTFVFEDEYLLKKETINKMLSHDDRNTSNFNVLKEVVEKKDTNTMYEEALDKGIKLNVSKTYNYCGTRYKNDINKLNDVPIKASDGSIVFSGYTGPAFLIDFDKKIIILIMCNVVHNSYKSRDDRKNMTFSLIEKVYNEII